MSELGDVLVQINEAETDHVLMELLQPNPNPKEKWKEGEDELLLIYRVHLEPAAARQIAQRLTLKSWRVEDRKK